MKRKQKIVNENFGKRKSVILRKVIPYLGILIAIAAIYFVVFFSVKKYRSNHISIASLKEAWAVYDYQNVYEMGKKIIEEKPFNNTALTYYSYACFFLAESQIDTQTAQTYLDECINNLRIALYNSSKSLTPQLQYMLGRAYFYKNTITSHYYADLAVKYLLLAKENGYESEDIAEYLGLSYASLGMTMESISAFTEALLIRESDSLLLSIAEQYYKAKEYNAAIQYLFRIIQTSKNDEFIVKSLNLLGTIYIDQEKYDDAMKEFEKVLEINENSGDAHYGIGVIYEKQGNIVKARSEWRKTLKLDVNHSGALQKMAEN